MEKKCLLGAVTLASTFSGQRTGSQIGPFSKGQAIIGAKLAGDVSGQLKRRFHKFGKLIMAKASKNPQLRLNLKMKTLEVDVWDEPSVSGPYMVEVIDGLFMGDSVSSRNRQLLSDRGIKVVFNLCAHRCVSPFADELTYHDYLLQDSQDGSYDRSWEPNMLQTFLLSFSAGALSTAISHPFEFLKLRAQVYNEGIGIVLRNQHSGYSMNLIYSQLANRGYGDKVLYTGFANALKSRMAYLGVRNLIYKIVYDQVKPAKRNNDLTLREKMLLSSFAGAAGAIASNPFEVRLVREVGELGRSEKFLRGNTQQAPMAGLAPAILRAVLINSIATSVYDFCKEGFFNTFGHNHIGKPWSCLVTSAVLTLTVLPVDAVKTRMQMAYADRSLNRLNYSNMVQCVQKAILNEGYNTLYAGSYPYFFKMFLYTVSTVWFCDIFTAGKYKNY